MPGCILSDITSIGNIYSVDEIDGILNDCSPLHVAIALFEVDTDKFA